MVNCFFQLTVTADEVAHRRVHQAHKHVFAGFLIIEDIKLQGTIDVTVTQLRHRDFLLKKKKISKRAKR